MKTFRNGYRKPGSYSSYAWKQLHHLRPLLLLAIILISIITPLLLFGYMLSFLQMEARSIRVPDIVKFQYRKMENMTNMNSSLVLDPELQSNIVSQIHLNENNLKRSNGTILQRKMATSIYLDFETISSMIHDIKDSYHQQAPNNFAMEGKSDFACKGNLTEDILCMTPPKPIKNMKNPCWFDALGIFRCLPFFQLIGFSKCASSDLFARICAHPQVLGNRGGNSKETKWWPSLRYGIYSYKGQSNSRKQTFADYLNYFSEAAVNISKNNSLVTGDGTPSDVWDFAGWPMIQQNKGLTEPVVLTPHLVRHINPHVKMIVILRDPVERLYSDFFSRGGISPKGFHQRVVDTIVTLHSCIRNATFRNCAYSWEYRLAEKTRVHIGFYSLYLREWFRVFSREQFLFLTTEEYSENMVQNMRKIFRFLEIDALSDEMMFKIAKNDRRNVSVKKQNVDPMLQSTRKILKELYYPFNVDLSLVLHDNKYMWKEDTRVQHKYI